MCTSIQSVQAAAARTQILSSLDIGLYSLFGQYDSMLLEDYDLFFLDGAQGGSSLNLGKIYDNMESYIKPVLKQNSQRLSLKQGGFTGYRLATDQNGEVFYRQVVTCMKADPWKSGCAGNYLENSHRKNRVRNRQNKTENRRNRETHFKVMMRRWIQRQKTVKLQKRSSRKRGRNRYFFRGGRKRIFRWRTETTGS